MLLITLISLVSFAAACDRSRTEKAEKLVDAIAQQNKANAPFFKRDKIQRFYHYLAGKNVSKSQVYNIFCNVFLTHGKFDEDLVLEFHNVLRDHKAKMVIPDDLLEMVIEAAYDKHVTHNEEALVDLIAKKLGIPELPRESVHINGIAAKILRPGSSSNYQQALLGSPSHVPSPLYSVQQHQQQQQLATKGSFRPGTAGQKAGAVPNMLQRHQQKQPQFGRPSTSSTQSGIRPATSSGLMGGFARGSLPAVRRNSAPSAGPRPASVGSNLGLQRQMSSMTAATSQRATRPALLQNQHQHQHQNQRQQSGQLAFGAGEPFEALAEDLGYDELDFTGGGQQQFAAKQSRHVANQDPSGSQTEEFEEQQVEGEDDVLDQEETDVDGDFGADYGGLGDEQEEGNFAQDLNLGEGQDGELEDGWTEGTEQPPLF